jgi:uncharacterized membrane protein YkvA (DUF1232 family)
LARHFAAHGQARVSVNGRSTATHGERAHVERDTIALYLAARDPRTPWYAKVLAAVVVVVGAAPAARRPVVVVLRDL